LNADNPSNRFPLSLREAAPAWIAILALTALAWILTLEQVQAMGNGAGTMGMSLVAFVAMWTAMMAAMMLPSMAPVAILWTRSILRQRWNAVAYYRIALFVFGYLLAWAFAGVLAFFGLAAFEQVLVLASSHGRWLGAAIFAIAGIYQLTSFKDVCLRHCRSPMSLLIHYTSFRGPAIDIRVGLHHGL
jgi:predicted metal-binding membrane protein